MHNAKPIEKVDGKYAVELGADELYPLFYGRLLDAQKIALTYTEYSREATDDEVYVLADLIVWLLTRMESLGYDEKARAEIFAELNEVRHRLGMN